ncbi:glycoside hydrolase family 127 protein [Streptomyces rubrogriseus]|uniref:glycoside hydrolase family 127 protein n=1 Tax=Streptomyces rubrogriseus TaxID=194673 RepID=UPI0036FD13C6
MATEDVRGAGLLLSQLDGPVSGTRFGVVHPLRFDQVGLESGGFLGAWQQRNASATIRHLINNLETSGVLHNFRRVADGEQGEFVGMDFADSDLYKTLEAIGWEAGRRGEPVETAFVDMAIDLISRTQTPSGYINTRVQGDTTTNAWANLLWGHELYCAGHLFQAAVALSRGAGDDRLLGIAERFAHRIITDLADCDDGYDGHAQIETALVELYRLTGNKSYLDFARTQIERRGHGNLPSHRLGREYFGDHQPIDDVDEATGHAVRQLYYMTGVTDLYLETGEERYRKAAERIWESAYTTKTYITGGQGSRHVDESFGDPYELPADRAYAETCAGIASFQWNWRMLLATGEARYAAQMETVLYNTIAGSVGLDGCHFFYTNPLQMRTGHRGTQEGSPNERLSWFECACCPPNLARLIASLHSYLATHSDRGMQIHHLTPGTAAAELPSGPVRITVAGNYPWTADFEITVDASGPFELAIRIPEWAQETTLTVDGVRTDLQADAGYLRIDRDWRGSSTVCLHFTLRPAIVHPHARIDAVRGTVALRRGPLVYCLESTDQEAGATLEDLRISLVPATPIRETASSAPGVAVALQADGVLVNSQSGLYDGKTPSVVERPTVITAIPYFAWGNRGQGAMRVWVPTA